MSYYYKNNNFKKEMNDKELMTPLERRIINGKAASEGDKAVKEKVFDRALRGVLNHEVVIEQENGEQVVMSTADLLAIKKVAYDLEHPENIDLNEYSKALGEQKNEVNVNIATAQEIFGDIAEDEIKMIEIEKEPI